MRFNTVLERKNSNEISKELRVLFDLAPPGELRNTIFEIYQVYIIREHHDGFPTNFSNMAEQLYALPAFLKKMENYP